jgi:hypothetical protein
MVFFLSLSSVPLVHIPCLVLRFCLQSQAAVIHVAIVFLRVSCHFQCSLLTSLMTEMSFGLMFGEVSIIKPRHYSLHPQLRS